jgi:acyl-CoA dehydrogenase
MSDDLRSMFASSARLLFEREVDDALLRAAECGPWPGAFWDAVYDAGYTNVLADATVEDVTWDDAFPLIAEAGRALAPVPFPETLLASWLLARAGIALPAGPIAVAPQANSTWRLEADGPAWRLSGKAIGVPWAADVPHCVLVVAGDDPKVVLVRGDALQIVRDYNLAREPRDTIEAREIGVVSVAALDGRFPSDVLDRFGALLRSAQISGAISRIAAQATRYARERKQFGRALVEFQAIGQQLAVLAEESVAAQTAAAFAFRAASTDPASPAIPAAKIRTGMAAAVAARVAHTVFAAIGYSYEHDLHFATRRLWSWRAEFGSETFWAREVGRNLIRNGSTRLWPDLVDGSPAAASVAGIA